MATVKDQEKEQRRRFDHRKGSTRIRLRQEGTFRRGSSNVGGCQASGTARQLNLPLLHDEQLRLDVAAVVVDLSWSWAPLSMALATMYMRS